MVDTDVLAGRILFRIANLGHKCDFLLISWAASGYKRDAEFSDSSALLPRDGGFERWILKGGREVDAGRGSRSGCLEGSQI